MALLKRFVPKNKKHPKNIQTALRKARDLLVKSGIPSADLDAQVLLADALNKDRSFLFAHGTEALGEAAQKQFRSFIKRRMRREPVAMITGHKEFFGLDFLVTHHSLIPRSETELLVETALAFLKKYPESSSLLDVGTGSGCIALSIACHAPRLERILAVDLSSRTLAVARKNAHQLGLNKRITFQKTDLIKDVRGIFDVIVSNLPYLSQKEYASAVHDCPEILYEPKNALIGGRLGIERITKLLVSAGKKLKKNGTLILEIGATQGDDLARVARRCFPQKTTSILCDAALRQRVLQIC